MEITQTESAGRVLMKLTGRLDAAWADHLSETIEAAVRRGAHHIVLHCAALSYISSMGLRVIIIHYKRLHAVQGSLAIAEPSAAVEAVLKAAGLRDLQQSLSPAHDASPQATVDDERGGASPRRADDARPGGVPQLFERGAAAYELYAQSPGSTLACTLLGEPDKLAGGSFTEGDCRRIELADGTLAVGLGAFGEGFLDARDRFGEMMAAGGAAIALPTAGDGVPDYVVAEGQLVPRVEALYAVVARGTPAHMLRFDAKADGPGVVGLSELVDTALQAIQAEAAGFVIVAEAAGVIGATLRRSPASGASSARPGGAPPRSSGTVGGDASPFDFPAVRDWLSFTGERSHDRQLALIVGVATRIAPPEAAPFLRPVGPGTSASGHFHGAVFPYRPVARGELPLAATVTGLLTAALPQTVVHLLADTRETFGVGETELLRGACWLGPLKEMVKA
jgi:anti-anti-sigma factor